MKLTCFSNENISSIISYITFKLSLVSPQVFLRYLYNSYLWWNNNFRDDWHSFPPVLCHIVPLNTVQCVQNWAAIWPTKYIDVIFGACNTTPCPGHSKARYQGPFICPWVIDLTCGVQPVSCPKGTTSHYDFPTECLSCWLLSWHCQIWQNMPCVWW